MITITTKLHVTQCTISLLSSKWVGLRVRGWDYPLPIVFDSGCRHRREPVTLSKRNPTVRDHTVASRLLTGKHDATRHIHFLKIGPKKEGECYMVLPS